MEEIKQLYVNEAEQMLSAEGGSKSLTQISLISGVHRKDVGRLLQKQDTKCPKADIVTRVLGLWQMGIEYQAPGGTPKLLTYRGKKSEFWNLVLAVSSDISPYSVLNELERIGAVEKIGGEVKIVSQMRQLTSDPTEAMACAGADIEDLIISIENNLKNSDATPELHIKTEYDSIPAHRTAELREWILDEGSAFHRRVREKLAKFDQDVTPPDRRTDDVVRVAVGSFGRIAKVLKRKR